MEADPAVRVGRVDEVLGGRAVDDGPREARGVGVALLTATSVTEALGLAVVGDFTEEPESGDTTADRAVGPGLEEVEEESVGFVTGVVPTFAPGASDVLRAGRDGVARGAVEDGGGMDTTLLPAEGAALDVFLRAEAAAGGLDEMLDAAALVVAAGAGRAAPGPELTACVVRMLVMKRKSGNERTCLLHRGRDSGLAGSRPPRY